MPIVRVAGNGTAPGRCLWLWCPGCDDSHMVTVDAPNGWTWDGNEAAPTIAPSILVHPHKRLIRNDLEYPALIAPENVTTTPRCHSFVRAGRWEFLSDCTHALAGQTVPMVPLPDWLSDEYVGDPA